MWIRFTSDAIYETEGVGRGPRFLAGEFHDLRDDLAHRWINRGLAVAEAPPPAKPQRAAKAPALEAPTAPAKPAEQGEQGKKPPEG